MQADHTKRERGQHDGERDQASAACPTWTPKPAPAGETWKRFPRQGSVVVAEVVQPVQTNDESEALGKLAEDCGGYAGRVIKIKLKAALPKIVECAVEAADEDESTEATSA